MTTTAVGDVGELDAVDDVVVMTNGGADVTTLVGDVIPIVVGDDAIICVLIASKLHKLVSNKPCLHHCGHHVFAI